MQMMVIEFARTILGMIPKANSTEFDPETTAPVIDLMLEQRHITDMGGTMRLGLYPCKLTPGSIAQRAYQADLVEERHRHRYELNNDYRDILRTKRHAFLRSITRWNAGGNCRDERSSPLCWARNSTRNSFQGLTARIRYSMNS